MEIFVIIYALVLLYGIGAFFQRSAAARFIASSVMALALMLHTCITTLLFGVGMTLFSAAWFTTSASGNTTQADVEAIQESGAEIAGGATPLIAAASVFGLVLLAFAIAHARAGSQLLNERKT